MSIDLSLDRLRVLVAHLPTYTRPTVHIAGTNGKGSVAAILSSVFSSSSLKTGRYNSPHLVNIYDCIVIDGNPVPAELYHQTRRIVEAKDRELALSLTNFELLTVTALQIFEVQKVDVVVLEVGMGGRLDATNIIPDETVLVSALTAVDLDHQAFLGDTVEKIAKEKAGIARPRTPFVLGAQTHASVEDVVQAIVQAAKAEIHYPPKLVNEQEDVNFSLLPFRKPSPQRIGTEYPLQFPLYGEHQLDNLATAFGVLDALTLSPYRNSLRHKITPSTITTGIANVQWPGRLSFETVKIPLEGDKTVHMNLLVDGAHNASSAKSLSAYITHLLERDSLNHEGSEPHTVNITYILSLSHSPPKLPIQMVSELLPIRVPQVSRTINVKMSVALPWFSKPDGMPWIKRVPISESKNIIHDLVPEADIWTSNVQEEDDATNLMDALKWVAGRQKEGERNLVIVAGSLYLVADLYRVCGLHG